MAETPTLKSPLVQAPASLSPEAARTTVAGCVLAMLSHQGRVRHANQDACAALPELGAFVVCDGMGGAAAGEVASHLAVQAFLHTVGESVKHVRPEVVCRERVGGQTRDDGDPECMATCGADSARTRLRDAVCAANQAVFRYSRRSPGLHGMGTTLVGALWDECDARTLWLAHVGDSRCYRLRGGMLERLTEDHSLVEEQVRAGTLSRVDAEVSPIRNIITRAVGSEPVVEPEIAAHATQGGDVYLLATDGLTRELEDARIACILRDVLCRTESDGLQCSALEAACHALIDAANEQGGRDNITVLLIGCV